MKDELVEFLVKKYIKSGFVIGLGTSSHAEKFLTELAKKKEDGFAISIVPTSTKMAGIIVSLGLNISNISDQEIDVSIEFVDLVDEDFNFIKRDSHSVIRDKMIGQSAAELIVITESKNYVKTLKGIVPVEVSTFGWRRTIAALENFGTANLRTTNEKPFKTETGNYLVDLDVEDIFELEDLEYKLKEIPGVIETCLFLGYADRIVLLNGKQIEVKSRIQK